MAVSVPLSILTPHQLEQIASTLTFQFVEEKPARKRNKWYHEPPKEPISFYKLDGAAIRVPFMYGQVLLQTMPNLDRTLPQCDYQFTGTLRDYQESIIAEALAHIQRYRCTTLSLDPGMGKTALGAYLAVKLGLPTVVLVHRTPLVTQWKKTFETMTNAIVWVIGERAPPRYDVIICMDQRADRLPQELRDQIGFMIVDEAHCFCTPNKVNCLMSWRPRYVLLESASLERDDDMHGMMYALAGEHAVSREPDKPFSVVKVATNVVPNRRQTRRNELDWAELVQSTLMNEHRNQIILALVQNYATAKILILTSLIAHAESLNERIRAIGIRSDCLCGDHKTYQDETVLVGTVSKIGTGFDPATFCETYDGRPFNILILVCSMKKRSMMIQNVGRVFRAYNPIVLHLVDNDPTYKSHWYEARRWYLSRNATITDCVFPPLSGVAASSSDPPDAATNHKAWLAARAARPK